MHPRSIQETIAGNHCVGCSPQNEHGLQIRSFWSGVMETECRFQPRSHMASASASVLNGGIIATLIDCHAVCSAVSYARRVAEPGLAESTMFATGSLEVRFCRPTPIDRPVQVRAKIVAVTERKIVLECTLRSGSEDCAEATVTAVRVNPDWDRGLRHSVPPPAQTLGGWILRSEETIPISKSA